MESLDQSRPAQPVGVAQTLPNELSLVWEVMMNQCFGNPNLPCDFGERGPLQPLTFDGFEGSPEQLLVAESSNMRSGHDIGARLLD